MTGGDIFNLYRQMLALVVGTYVLVRTAHALLNWQAVMDSKQGIESLALRYLLVQVIRIRVRRFALDLVQIAALLVMLAYLLWLHA